MKAVWIILVAAVLSFAQTTTKKVSPPARSAPAAKPDTWEKSKECASQAEKVMADPGYAVAQGSAGYVNHYSPKYNRCFIEVYHFIKESVKGGPLTSTVLVDAFERSGLANTSIGIKPEIACRNEANREQCEDLAREIWKIGCQIDGTPADCDKAKDFIAEHMKN